ncbi:hypothetical protein FHR70_001560 [Microvirga lupini]|uniref:Uncharacterized protein n=1 Tax=Microvirga lupini TaxID=420324 RepID=A0A7W4VJZ4_9HYPH|nr:hypothetical protein [Microvirga lupini]
MSRLQRNQRSVFLCLHPEEARSAVSKELPVRSGASFETPAPQAPQDEGSGSYRRKEEVD